MNLSKENQKKLLLTGIITAVALAGLWFGLIRTQNVRLVKLQAEQESAEKKLRDFELKIKTAAESERQLEDARRELGALEDNMAAGDPYIWIVDTIRQFKLAYKDVDIRQFSSIVLADSSTLLPRFPYKQATITISGTGYYHEIGRFISDMENRFPHMRLQNLVIEHLPAATDTRETLLFRVDVLALVKSQSI
jgi:Tfp pilus assembly protein PilO